MDNEQNTAEETAEIKEEPVKILKDNLLTEKQKKWWKKLYFNGLGEFFYRNGIEADFEDFMEAEGDLDESIFGLYFSVGKGESLLIGGYEKDVTESVSLFLKEKLPETAFEGSRAGRQPTKRCRREKKSFPT